MASAPRAGVATTVQRVVINQDNTVELVTERREAVSTIPDVLRAIQGSGMTTPILPYGTIQAIFKEGSTRYCMLVPPKMMDVTYIKDEDESPLDAPRSTIFTIAVPWTLFVFSFVGKNLMDVWSAIAKPPILDSFARLYALPLPNCDKTGKRCMGSDFGMMINGQASAPADKIAKALAYFDSSRYNGDLRMNCDYLPDKILALTETIGVWGKLKAWADWTASASNPLSDVCALTWYEMMRYNDIIERSVV